MSSPAYRERWVVPLLLWPAALGLATLAAAELHGGAPGVRAYLPYAVLLPLTAVLLAIGSRGVVTVADGMLQVPGARIPIALLSDGVVLDRQAFRVQTGPMADPRAYVASRPWLHTAVRLTVADPNDATPYWVVGTRRPAELLAAMRTQAEAGQAQR